MLLRFRLPQVLWVVVIATGMLVFGSDRAEAEQALASWYGPGFHGLPTATGEQFNAYGYTAAHKTLPLGTVLVASYEGNSVQVTVNDRGPYIGTRSLDFSQGAAQQLGLIEPGVDYVEIAYVSIPQTGGSGIGTGDPPPQTSPTAQDAPNSAAHVVQIGESLSGIAAQLGTSTEYLMAQNSISDPNLIYGGQTLLL